MAPPGVVISQPDTGIAVGTDIGGSGKECKAHIGIIFPETLVGTLSHHGTVQVMDSFVGYPFPIDQVLECIAGSYRIVKEALDARQFTEFQEAVFLTDGVDLLCGAVETVCSGKHRGFIHVIPKTMNAHVQVTLIAMAKPFAGFLLEIIREHTGSGPDISNKVFTLIVPAENIPFRTCDIFRDIFILADGHVHDGNQMDPLFQFFLYETFRIREILLMPSEVLVFVQAIDVHTEGIDGQTQLFILSQSFIDTFFANAAEAGLDKSKGPLGGQIAGTDQLTEFLDDRVNIRILNDID